MKKYFIIAGLIMCAGFGVVTSHTGTAESVNTVRLIKDQGSSPYCLFAVNAYLINGDMWELERSYYQHQLPVTPTNTHIFTLLKERGYTMTVPKQWKYEQAAAQVQFQPVGASGHGHAIVLLSWRNGKITYLDSLHADTILTMTDSAFWAWSDGWYWWLK